MLKTDAVHSIELRHFISFLARFAGPAPRPVPRSAGKGQKPFPLRQPADRVAAPVRACGGSDAGLCEPTPAVASTRPGLAVHEAWSRVHDSTGKIQRLEGGLDRGFRSQSNPEFISCNSAPGDDGAGWLNPKTGFASGSFSNPRGRAHWQSLRQASDSGFRLKAPNRATRMGINFSMRTTIAFMAPSSSVRRAGRTFSRA